MLALEVVVADGTPEEAAAFARSHLATRRPYVNGGLVSVVAVALAVATRQPAWLLLAAAWWGLMPVVRTLDRQRNLRWLSTVALRPGSLLRVEWRRHALAVHRPAGAVYFPYDGMELIASSERLTMLWVHNTMRGGKRRKVLTLPSALVPPDAVARFQHAAPTGEDPFDAAEMPRVFRVPAGWPSTSYHLTAARKAAVVALLVFEALALALLAAVGAWVWTVTLLALLALALWWCRTFVSRSARRQLPPGSVAGADLTGGRIRLGLPDQRLDLPESELRNVVPAGADVVLLVFRPTVRGPIFLPRALVTDDEIDRLRRVAGRPPMKAEQRAVALAGTP